MLDEDGKTVNTYKYDIWGQLLESNETVPNAIRYNHEYYDTESGFYYLRGRYYDPSIRRFTTPDPAEDGINWYAYCGNNPVDFIDPSGYARVKIETKVADGYVIKKYYSGDDLKPLYPEESDAIEDVSLSMAKGGRKLAKVATGTAAAGLGVLGSLGALIFGSDIVGKMISSNITKDNVATKAKQAYQTGQGIMVKAFLSTDDDGFAVEEISILSASIVEDLEKQHGRASK